MKHDANNNTQTPIKKIAALVLGIVFIALSLIGNLLAAVARTFDLIRTMYLDFRIRPDDIFIVSYPRSGTTWMQMVLYQLATDGNMDIPHISVRCPFFEANLSFHNSGEIYDESPPPRIFKSHLSYRWIPKGPCKYIYIARNGKDVLVSYFHHYKDTRSFRGQFSQFFNRFLHGRLLYGSWFKHVGGWHKHRNDGNVLFLTYEEMTGDLEASIKKIIAFCGFQIEPERFPAILERCSFDFMKQHESKFEPIAEAELQRGIKRDAFIRKGQVGAWKEQMDSRQEGLFEREFERRLGKLGISFEAASKSASAIRHSPL